MAVFSFLVSISTITLVPMTFLSRDLFWTSWKYTYIKMGTDFFFRDTKSTHAEVTRTSLTADLWTYSDSISSCTRLRYLRCVPGLGGKRREGAQQLRLRLRRQRGEAARVLPRQGADAGELGPCRGPHRHAPARTYTARRSCSWRAGRCSRSSPSPWRWLFGASTLTLRRTRFFNPHSQNPGSIKPQRSRP